MMTRKFYFLTAIGITFSAMTFAGTSEPIAVRDTITDANFELPQSYIDNLENNLNDWYLRNYTAYAPESGNQGHDVNIPDSVYRQRLRDMGTVIDMPYNQIVRSCIDRYMRNSRSSLSAILGRSTRYLPLFEQALEEAGLPLELKYLAVVESAMRPDVTSRAGASGLWQFMVSTGREYGLAVTSLIDERRDPYKSTVAAVKYLGDLYKMFGDWHLALAAYNCGPGRVARSIRTTGKNDFWGIYYTLPSETRMYVPLFIAANYAMTYYRKHNIEPVLATKPLTTDTITVQNHIKFEHISQVMNIPMEALQELNPQYRCNIIPGSKANPYVLTLPSGDIYTYIALQDSIIARAESEQITTTEEEVSTEPTPRYHRVRKGETLSKIARKYGTSVKNIKKWNGLRNDRLSIGQSLIVGWNRGTTTVRSSEGSSSASSSRGQATTSAEKTYHRVKKGETLSTIAQRYGISVRSLKRANGLRSDRIRAGQRLTIPR